MLHEIYYSTARLYFEHIIDSAWANQGYKRPGKSKQVYCSYCIRETLIRYGGLIKRERTRNAKGTHNTS